jgi:hypothetical protein
VSRNFSKARRDLAIFSLFIEPETSNKIPTEIGASESLKKVISCSSLLSKIENAFLSKPET